MGQFDIHVAKDGELLVDIQADVLSGLTTRVVVPLIPLTAAPPQIRQLNPEIVLEGASYLLLTQYLSAVHTAELGTVVGSIKPLDQRVSLALDLLLHGI
jgi:toxin CcdB